MIRCATRVEAALSRRHYVSPHGAEADVETYIGVNKALLGDTISLGPSDELSPNAYRVCQMPGAELRPHYHQADQFQLFVAGSGRIGTHAVAAVTVHFASAHSPYGPIVAGPCGMEYLTLRRRFDPGAQWMPEHAQRLRAIEGRVHRSVTSAPLDRQSVTDAAPGQSRVTPVIQDELACACLVDLGPAAFWRAPIAADGFVYVLFGQVQFEGRSMPADACLFASRDEGALGLATGGAPARLLLLQFLVD